MTNLQAQLALAGRGTYEELLGVKRDSISVRAILDAIRITGLTPTRGIDRDGLFADGLTIYARMYDVDARNMDSFGLAEAIDFDVEYIAGFEAGWDGETNQSMEYGRDAIYSLGYRDGTAAAAAVFGE